MSYNTGLHNVLKGEGKGIELIIRAIFTVPGGREGGVGRGSTERVVITQVMEGQQQRKL